MSRGWITDAQWSQAASIETAECTPMLRWRNGVLQQRWLVTKTVRGQGVLDMCSGREEWRDVPQVRE